MTYASYFVRLLARYGAVPLLLLLVIAILLALRSAPRLAARFNEPGAMLLGILVCLAGAAVLIAPAALRGTIGLVQVFRAAISAPPPLTGPYNGADATITLTSDADAGQGPVLVRLWYPADKPPGQQAGGARPVPCAQLDAVMRLPPSQTPYPFILFAPSLGGKADQASILTRSLANHGYIVAAFDDLALDPPPSDASAEEEAARLLSFDLSSEEGYNTTLRLGAMRVESEVAKALSIVDRLTACVQMSPVLQNRIDFKRIGFVGYSFGGAAAAEASLKDARIAAVVNMDGAQFGRSGDIPVNVPYFAFSSGFDWRSTIDPNSSRRYEFLFDQRAVVLLRDQVKRPDSYAFLIRGSVHDTFADPSPTLRNFRRWLFVDPYRAQTIIATYLLGFLDAYVKGDRRGLIGPSDHRFPDVLALEPQD